jgi:tripartite-type tricarboxylate transporter receptor subunit TctC
LPWRRSHAITIANEEEEEFVFLLSDDPYKTARAAILALLTAAAAPLHAAETYPTKPVRIIVPFGAGGGTDIQGRLLGKKFFDSMGQTFIVDNRPGASGLIGTELAAKSPPDGYTILFTTASLSVNVTLYGKRLTIDPTKDLQPISWISSVPLVLVVHPTVPARNVRDLVRLAKSSGKMNAGHNGAGTTSHLAIEMLEQSTGIRVAPVPYKGGGPSMTALISGEVDFNFATALTAAPQLKTGRIRALAVTTAKPSSAFPQVPTMSSIYPGFEVDNWYAMFLPAGAPAAVVQKLNGEIRKALGAPDVREFMTREGADPVGSSPEELAAYFKREVAKYAEVIRKAEIAIQ